MNGFYKEVIAALKQHGYSFLRPGKGAHELWKRGRVTVVVSYNVKSRHTANCIMKEAGIDFKL